MQTHKWWNIKRNKHQHSCYHIQLSYPQSFSFHICHCILMPCKTSLTNNVHVQPLQGWLIWRISMSSHLSWQASNHQIDKLINNNKINYFLKEHDLNSNHKLSNKNDTKALLHSHKRQSFLTWPELKPQIVNQKGHKSLAAYTQKTIISKV